MHSTDSKSEHNVDVAELAVCSTSTDRQHKATSQAVTQPRFGLRQDTSEHVDDLSLRLTAAVAK